MDTNRKQMRDKLNQRVNEEKNARDVNAQDQKGKKYQKFDDKTLKEMRDKNVDFMEKSMEDYDTEVRAKSDMFTQAKSSLNESKKNTRRNRN